MHEHKEDQLASIFRLPPQQQTSHLCASPSCGGFDIIKKGIAHQIESCVELVQNAGLRVS